MRFSLWHCRWFVKHFGVSDVMQCMAVKLWPKINWCVCVCVCVDCYIRWIGDCEMWVLRMAMLGPYGLLLHERADTDMICGFDKAMSVHVHTCTLHLFFRILAWIGWFKVDDCGISRVNFKPTWHVKVTVRHLSYARSFIAHKALYW